MNCVLLLSLIPSSSLQMHLRCKISTRLLVVFRSLHLSLFRLINLHQSSHFHPSWHSFFSIFAYLHWKVFYVEKSNNFWLILCVFKVTKYSRMMSLHVISLDSYNYFVKDITVVSGTHRFIKIEQTGCKIISGCHIEYKELLIKETMH